jgi:hypothetical protein
VPDTFLIPYAPNRAVAVTMSNPLGTDYWDFAAGGWTAFDAARAADFALSLSCAGRPPQEYAGQFPAAIAPGDYDFVAYDVAGAAWAVTDTPIGGGTISWDGTHIVSRSINDARAGGPTGIRNMVYDLSLPTAPRLLSYDSVLYDTMANATLNDGVTGAIEVMHVTNRYDTSGLLMETISTHIRNQGSGIRDQGSGIRE